MVAVVDVHVDDRYSTTKTYNTFVVGCLYYTTVGWVGITTINNA